MGERGGGGGWRALGCCWGSSWSAVWLEKRPSRRFSGAMILCWCLFCEHIHYFRRRCRPVPPLRRLTFVLSKVSKTAGSHIRPYASLRVPSLRCPPGAARPTTCFAKSTTRALRLRRRGLRPRPFRTPPLGLLKSQVTGGALRDGSSRFGSDFDRRPKEPELLLFMRVSSDAANCDFSRPSGGACRGRVRKYPSAIAEDVR